MEWVETTGKTVDEAKELALDQLGVAADEAEFEIVEAPRPGLFGRLRGEARVRSRVRPAELRPKRERRRRRSDASDAAGAAPAASSSEAADASPEQEPLSSSASERSAGERPAGERRDRERSPQRQRSRRTSDRTSEAGDSTASSAPTDEDAAPSVDPGEVGAAAVSFVEDLVTAMGIEGTTTRLSSDGTELEVVVEGERLGLLIGPGGRTLLAIQSLARVAAQRRLGDHETRLRIDVAGYRAKRKAALEAFASKLAEQVVASGEARSLEPMPSADRKIVHDILSGIDGVESRSVGDDPFRRVVVAPASIADAS